MRTTEQRERGAPTEIEYRTFNAGKAGAVTAEAPERLIIMKASVANVLDQHGDIMLPGWADKAIARDLPLGDIKMLVDHWEPIGVQIEVEEKVVDGATVLRSVGRVTNDPAFDKYLAMAMDGTYGRSSIGFSAGNVITSGEEFDEYRKTHGPELKRVVVTGRLWEVSPVLWGSNPDAFVDEVRAAQQEREHRLQVAVRSLAAAAKIVEDLDAADWKIADPKLHVELRDLLRHMPSTEQALRAGAEEFDRKQKPLAGLQQSLEQVLSQIRNYRGTPCP